MEAGDRCVVLIAGLQFSSGGEKPADAIVQQISGVAGNTEITRSVA